VPAKSKHGEKTHVLIQIFNEICHEIIESGGALKESSTRFSLLKGNEYFLSCFLGTGQTRSESNCNGTPSSEQLEKDALA